MNEDLSQTSRREKRSDRSRGLPDSREVSPDNLDSIPHRARLVIKTPRHEYRLCFCMI
eukprot:Ihof_evm1s1112 gene=Ihof_evmTU1s1112